MRRQRCDSQTLTRFCICIVRAPPEKVLADQLSKLAPEERARFLRLGNANLHSDPAVSIFQTNAVSVGKDTAGVCPTFSRINHACLGGFNVVYNWREEEQDISELTSWRAKYPY